MKNFIAFDFSVIETIEDFYQQFKEKLELPEFFGNNLDAVYDVLTADVEMPLEIEFANMNLNQLEEFDELLQTLEDVVNEDENFSFSYFLEIYEDDEDFEEDWEEEDEDFDTEEE